MTMKSQENVIIPTPNLSWFQGAMAALKPNTGLLLGPLAAAFIWLIPIGLEPVQQKALAITAFMIVYWIAEPIDHGLTALIGIYLFWALQVAKFPVAFSGFVNSTTWFLFSSLLMAEAAARTGLAKRIGFLFMSKVGSSTTQILAGLLSLSFVLTLFVPSGMGRIAILAPLAAGIFQAAGLTDRSNVVRGFFAVLTAFSGISDVMILSGATSMMTHAILQEQAGIQVLWSQWFIAFLPLNLVMIVASVAITRWLYPGEISELSGGKKYFEQELARMGPWSESEKKSLIWFGLAVGLWSTDFIHRTNPAVIGLAAGLLMSLPKIGVLDRKAVKQNNFLIIIFSAGAISMGNVLLQTNTLPLLTERVIGWMEPLLHAPISFTLMLYLGGFFYHFIFANRQSMLITSLPVLLVFANAHGLDLVSLALLWTIGGGGGLFIYQSGVYVLGYSYGYFQASDFFKIGVVLTLIEGVLLVLLVKFYWPLIGMNWLRQP
jgi:solute carrier family 13 (sodium-dependent dicarboxylate transporter), member 2/3/5